MHATTSRCRLSAKSCKTLFLSGGGSEKSCLLKTAAVNSEHADFANVRRVIKLGGSVTSLITIGALKRNKISYKITLICCHMFS